MPFRYLVCCVTFLCTMIISGCADPITRTINDVGYYPLYPPVVDKMYIGNTYQDLKIKKPICLIKMYDKDPLFAEIQSTMQKSKQRVKIEERSEEKIYKLSGNVEILKNIKGELKISGIKRFSLKLQDLERFEVDLNIMLGLLPQIKKVCSRVDITDKFVLYDLLKVGSIEYTFYDENEAIISLATLPESNKSKLEEVIKGDLGLEWKVTKTGGLKSNEPLYLGYRPILITEDGPIFKGVKSQEGGIKFVPLDNK